MLKLRVAGILILVVALALVSCSKKQEATPTKAAGGTPTAGATIAATTGATAAATSSAASAGDPAKGKTLFQSLPCAGCHGPNAEGGIGPNLKQTKPSPERITDMVRNGRSPMPAFSKSQVSDQDLQDIIAFIQSLK